MNEERFNLIAAQLDAVKQEMITRLNRDLFRSIEVAPLPPLTWREKLCRGYERAVRYLATLRRALKGDDPYECEWDD